MTTATRTLSTVISANPYCDPIKDGRVKIPGIEMEQITVNPMIQAFRRMTRGLEFQICEVAVVTYFTARQYGVPITALPSRSRRGVGGGRFMRIRPGAA